MARSRPYAPTCRSNELIDGSIKIKGSEIKPAGRDHRQISGSITRLARGPTVENLLKDWRTKGAVTRVATRETSRPARSQLLIFFLNDGREAVSPEVMKMFFKIGSRKRIPIIALKDSWNDTVYSCRGVTVRINRAAKARSAAGDFFRSVQMDIITIELMMTARKTGVFIPASSP